MKNIPKALILSRIFIGVVILLLAIYAIPHFRAIIITLVAVGLLTDIFDGIIARQLKISSVKLRRMDSNVDMIFWVCIIVAAYVISPLFFRENWLKLCLLIGFELVSYVFSYIKFKKEVATHAIGSKLWALVLFATLIQLIAVGNSVILFNICFYLGLLTRLEIILMLIVIKKWTNDIPTLYHAFRIRKDKPIKRHKLFNG
ncbi:CDP-diacylglycerol--glycerol-3-phosphate 3-phosphatidyltransferase [Mucilaginibacter gracilis]|uniref:CDP-diacylglycerol--glycerol-3-phosphate 3-phosphatidyltransferase n=1 Tax=Mucilaginibacter gracilis TaxID=423350 RepID=A0A495J3N6_9SPHI|nr:CDP-alcohol phosphatidyltransferase family protein [Mucilaginibacter gracilis]RKR83595.1 CDP-diacylglycerol--glycerol-3-phosphate 3-phosphatidyltransferase [Mucilaginibacter gracilis]